MACDTRSSSLTITSVGRRFAEPPRLPEELLMAAPTMDHLELTDLSDPIMFTNPFPRYAELRRNSPVSRVRSKQLMRKGGYLLARYDDVMMLHTDKRFSNDDRPGLMKLMPRMFRLLADSMVFKDDPDHKRLRGLVNKAFAPKMVQRMANDIDRTVAVLLDDLDGRDVVDLVEQYAVPLPLSVIAEMLGVSDADRDRFHMWMRRFSEGVVAGPIQLIRALPNGQRMMRLFERLAEQRRAEPDDRLISALVRAKEEGDHLNDQEVLAMIFLLLLAGHESTANLIGSATLALLDNPEQLVRLRENPELIDTAVEELLRYTTPTPCGAARITLEDVEVAGVTIPKGSNVLGMIISANRDEGVFDHPDVLDLGRDPNRHITFAVGAHYCLGSELARLEGRTAIAALVQRFEHIELAVARSELRYKPTQSLRGLRSLPIRLR
ncbi:MAG: cytochrome P450 family protein [Gammaproteobacteria bacterium]